MYNIKKNKNIKKDGTKINKISSWGLDKKKLICRFVERNLENSFNYIGLFLI